MGLKCAIHHPGFDERCIACVAITPKPFVREDRYAVLKRKDVNRLPHWQKEALLEILVEIETMMPLREYVVVESGWPEYEVVWDMIQARVEGRPNQLATLQSELAAANKSRDREAAAYDKLNAAFIDLNLDLAAARAELRRAKEVLINRWADEHFYGDIPGCGNEYAASKYAREMAAPDGKEGG